MSQGHTICQASQTAHVSACPTHAHAGARVLRVLQVSEHPKCRIKLTILDESSGEGKAAGHKVKLTAALVLAGTTTEGLSKPGR